MIGEIENAILERLKTVNASGALGYKIKTIASYAGDASDDPVQATRDYPAIWIIYKKSVKGAVDIPSHIPYTAQFYIICAAKSLRNERVARYGNDDSGEVGACQIAEDCASILHFFKPPNIEGAKQCIAGDIDPLFADKKGKSLAAIYALDLSVGYQFKPDKFVIDSANPLQAVHTNWDLPPNGEVGATLPDDENADATSHVTGD